METFSSFFSKVAKQFDYRVTYGKTVVGREGVVWGGVGVG